MNSLEDELALRNLMARYSDAVNRVDADAWIATWAQDAVWNLLGNPVSGKDNILALWKQMMSSFEFALMLPSTCLFQVDGDTASGHWYLTEYTRDPEGAASTVLSRYTDTYTRKDGQWLFQSRDYSFIYNGPADLSGTYTPP
ncbi:MAG: nuclear transport factor 2 family protein [Halioglobus sp.]|nr:nuclear transport factor 2 family protein [Halioglobus sp.]